MICARKFFQDCARAESLAERLELLQVCQRIPRPLQKQHGDVNLEKMLAAVLGGAPGGMQRKAEKRQSTNAWKRRDGLSLRRHPAAEGFPSRDERGIGQKAQRRGYGSANGGMSKFWWIWPLAAPFHIRELIPQGGDAALREPNRNRRHERVRHASAGAMCQHETGTRSWRRLQEAGDLQRIVNRNCDRFCLRGGHGCVPKRGRRSISFPE